jgi:aryl-alcohol dehydrogenase-like predicted oxidoreductase
MVAMTEPTPHVPDTSRRPDRPHRPDMPVAPLGRSGLHVSRLALGTMTFGVETAQDDAFAQLDLFREHGGTLLDTADVYGAGESERIIGRWLADRRPTDTIIATKGRFAPPPGSAGASRRALVRAVDASLDRLGVDALDLYFVHGWDAVTPVAETLDTLTSLVRAGKIHHLGWSNVTGWQLATIMTTAELGGFVVPCAVQPQYNLLDRGIETELLPCCLDEDLAVTPWSPLGGGWLTGKYRPDERPAGATRLGEDPNRGVEAYDVRNTDRTWAVLEVVDDIARQHDVSMAEVAIAWLLARPGVAAVLLGARTVAQLAGTLTSAQVALTDDDLARLTAVSAPGLAPYPYEMIEEFCDVDHWRRLGVAHR